MKKIRLSAIVIGILFWLFSNTPASAERPGEESVYIKLAAAIHQGDVGRVETIILQYKDDRALEKKITYFISTEDKERKIVPKILQNNKSAASGIFREALLPGAVSISAGATATVGPGSSVKVKLPLDPASAKVPEDE